MNDFTIRPTLKFIKAGAIAAALVFLALEILYLAEWRDQVGAWVMALPPLILVWPLVRWLKWRTVRIVVTADLLRYEQGFFSHYERNMELSKLQCVNARQTFKQRLFNVGAIEYETAGQGTWTPMIHVDSPRQIADELMKRAQAGPPGLRSSA